MGVGREGVGGGHKVCEVPTLRELMMASRVQVVVEDSVETVESATRVRVQDQDLHLTLLMVRVIPAPIVP